MKRVALPLASCSASCRATLGVTPSPYRTAASVASATCPAAWHPRMLQTRTTHCAEVRIMPSHGKLGNTSWALHCHQLAEAAAGVHLVQACTTPSHIDAAAAELHLAYGTYAAGGLVHSARPTSPSPIALALAWPWRQPLAQLVFTHHERACWPPAGHITTSPPDLYTPRVSRLLAKPTS